jgi:methylated-DNA-[protein]-cysteine S-methyltransferase
MAERNGGVLATSVPAPWGPIHLAAGPAGIVGVELMTPDGVFESTLGERLRTTVEPVTGAPARDPRRRLIGRLGEAIEAYLRSAWQLPDDLPLDFGGSSTWDVTVFGGVRQVGFGSVISYGGVGRLIGRPGAARAVGGAVGRNPIGLLVPCHRVIAGDGGIGGYGGDWWGTREERVAVKRTLLELEGVELPARPDRRTGLSAG